MQSMDPNTEIKIQYDKIYRYCYFKLGNRHAAEDITQETFLRFLESKTYANTGKSLQYLYTTARNLCIDEYRRRLLQQKYIQEPVSEEATTGWENQVLPQETLMLTMAVREALKKLPEAERELLLLRYANEVPVAVIARLFGISRFAVYRKIKAALELLRQTLRKEDFL